MAGSGGFSLLCGRYEGVDDRIRTTLVDGELSLGDFVLAGGEVAAMVVIEAVGRLVPGVMGNDTSADDESFGDGLLEYPQYTATGRASAASPSPPCFDRAITTGSPDGGGRRAVQRTLRERPDLIEARGGISDDEERLLDEFPED